MKPLALAIALAVFASPALALEIAPPFELTQFDRMLPDIQFAPAAPYVADSRAPYEQLAVDRALPNLPMPSTQFRQTAAAADGSTRLDAGTDSEAPAESPWANDFNFISPAQ